MVGKIEQYLSKLPRWLIILVMTVMVVFSLYHIEHAHAKQAVVDQAKTQAKKQPTESPQASRSVQNLQAFKHMTTGALQGLQQRAKHALSSDTDYIHELSSDKGSNQSGDDMLKIDGQESAKRINNFPYSVAAILRDEMPNAQSFPPGGFPHVVKVGFILNDMSSVDDLTGNITISATITEKWHDDRLRYKSTTYGTDNFIFIFAGNKAREELEKIWQPYLRLQNIAGRINMLSDLLVIQPNGLVVYQIKFNSAISTNITVQKYPFVVQDVGALISSQVFDSNLIKLESLPKMEGVYGVASSPGWQVDKAYKTEVLNLKHEKKLRAKFSTYVLTFVVRSHSTSFILEVMFPLIALSVLASILFWISQFDHQRRINLALILLMSMVAYQYLMYNAIPRASYITFMNLLSIGSLIFMFLTLLCIIVVENVETKLDLPEDEKDEHGVPIKVPRVTQIMIDVCKWVLPALYAIYIIVICLVMLI